jgi:fatty acid amide hydrolase 2
MAVAAPPRRLTERSASDLARAIRAGEVSSREVVQAHVARLRDIQPRLNAVAAERFEAALAEAEAADNRVAAADEHEALPPLLGVPCTIKESIALAGMPNCAGLLSRREHRAVETAPAVRRLLEAGAIPLAVTNTPELCLWIESHNFVYGRTRNAYDPRRVAGGSSGGEGAAVGAGGSPLGLGSDIGGSIRLPAFFNGVFGHKCSAWMVPNTGHFPPAEGEVTRMLSLGPLARRAEDLMPALRIIAGPDGVDPFTRTVELGDPSEVELQGLPVVVSEEASLIPVRRELREARERAAAALAAAGARVRRLPLRSMRRALDYFMTAVSAGSTRTMRELLEAEAGETARLTLRRAGWGAVRRRGPHTLPTVMLLASESLAARTPQRHTRRALAAGKALAAEVEAALEGGVLLHPPHPRVAPRHGRTLGRMWVLTPTAVFNLLGLPVTQVPLGLNPKGLPLGVQVVAGMDRDHVAIAAALELERAFGGWMPPPRQ